MRATLERYKRQATLLGEPRDELLSEDRWADLVALDRILQGERTTKRRLHDIWLNGQPMNISGGLLGLIGNPVLANQATVTGGATELVIIPTALLPIEQNVGSGKTYLIYASGTSTTAATPGTYTLALRIGPAPTNASPLFGAVSGALTPVASATAAQWNVFGFVVMRGGGTADTAVANMSFSHSATVGGGGPVGTASDAVIGGISASFDSTLATTALWLGVTHATSTTNTWVPQMVLWASLN
jgi:hypothetical protein